MPLSSSAENGSLGRFRHAAFVDNVILKYFPDSQDDNERDDMDTSPGLQHKSDGTETCFLLIMKADG